MLATTFTPARYYIVDVVHVDHHTNFLTWLWHKKFLSPSAHTGKKKKYEQLRKNCYKKWTLPSNAATKLLTITTVGWAIRTSFLLNKACKLLFTSININCQYKIRYIWCFTCHGVCRHMAWRKNLLKSKTPKWVWTGNYSNTKGM